MATALDFDFGSAKIQAWQTSANVRQPSSFASEYEKELAKLVRDGDEQYDPENTGCYGCFQSYGPSGRFIEFMSAVLSLLCLLGTVGVLCWAYARQPDKEHGELKQPPNPYLARVRMSKEVLLFTNEVDMVHAMRHMQTEYNGFCNKTKFKIDLQGPTWNKTNADDFKYKKNSTMYGMTTSVHAGSVSLFGVVLPIYIFSVFFQFMRFREYCTKEKLWWGKGDQGLYKPWLGPDFSRWLEYLFTSPLQIFVVATAFGFANRDTVSGLCGMQAALVLFGYDIEQQIKKIYKRDQLPSNGYKNVDSTEENLAPRRFHNILWKYPVFCIFTLHDIRGCVYLAVAWLLHSLIWVSIFNRYYDQQKHQTDCGTNSNAEIPDVVTFFMYSQGVAFTLFGVLNTWQFCEATLCKENCSRKEQFRLWNWYSKCYGVLSITAKLFLEAGFVWYVTNARTWPLAEVSNIVRGNMLSGQQCWSVQN